MCLVIAVHGWVPKGVRKRLHKSHAPNTAVEKISTAGNNSSSGGSSNRNRPIPRSCDCPSVRPSVRPSHTYADQNIRSTVKKMSKPKNAVLSKRQRKKHKNNTTKYQIGQKQTQVGVHGGPIVSPSRRFESHKRLFFTNRKAERARA